MGSRRVAVANSHLWPRSMLIAALFISSFLANAAYAQPVVLVSLAPIYALTAPLLQGTDVQLKLLPEEPRSMQAQATLFTRQAERFAESFAGADAVITIGKVWTADPLYTAAREVNIRVVNVDASKPWSHELDGVAVANSPASGQVSPYFWLSPSNVIRMLDIIATDLAKLYPDHALTIATNAAREKSSYVQMKSDFERRFIEVDDPVLYALTDEFVYLTSDLGVFVDAYFVKQDIDWTAEDYAALTQRLQDGGIKVVLHKWDPSEEIKKAIAAGGAQLLVLDNLETTADFRAGLNANLSSLVESFP